MRLRDFALWGLIAAILFAFMPRMIQDGKTLSKQVDWAEHVGAANAPPSTVAPVAVEVSEMGPITDQALTNDIYKMSSSTEADSGKEVTAPVLLLHQHYSSLNRLNIAANHLSGNAVCHKTRSRTIILSS